MAIKISVVITVLNEAHTIQQLMEALLTQSYKPNEVVVVDGGSSDGTVTLLKTVQKSNKTFALQILSKRGNRSVGRNWGIQKSRNKVLAITDAGCIPHKTWLAELVKKYSSSQAPVVAGYYDADPRTAFENAVVPYVLVPADKVNPETFLPATRSMLLEKIVWKEVGGFNERLSDNEDYVFAHALKNKKIKIAFAPKAKVTWIPRSNLQDFSMMLYRFARGDVQAGILRPKVLALFGRYIVALIFLMWLFVYQPTWIGPLFLLGVILYTSWAIYKNYSYAKKGWFWLPVLQFAADWAVMRGSVAGFFTKR